MLETRSLESHDSLCPAAYQIAETPSGSGVLCRITGRLVTTGHNPSSLAAFCWNPRPIVHDITTDGQEVRHGYCECPVWLHNRKRELQEADEAHAKAPKRVKDALEPGFITRQ